MCINDLDFCDKVWLQGWYSCAPVGQKCHNESGSSNCVDGMVCDLKKENLLQILNRKGCVCTMKDSLCSVHHDNLSSPNCTDGTLCVPIPFSAFTTRYQFNCNAAIPYVIMGP